MYQNSKRKIICTTISLILSFGSSLAQFAPTIELSDISHTGAGFVINGVFEYQQTGVAVNGVGDVNGDGIDDVIIGANSLSTSESVYVVFGNSTDMPATVELSLLNGTNGFVLDGSVNAGRIGNAISGAGDINGDGFDDLIIGDHLANPNNGFSGSSYVVFGKSDGFMSSVDLSTLNGSDGFIINAVEFGASFGFSVSGAGDVNGDGFDDVIIGAPHDNNFQGSSFVLLGKANGFSALIESSDLNGQNGFKLNGAASIQGAGFSVDGAGDVNGDGYDDLIVGTLKVQSTDTTDVTFVVFGKNGGFDRSLNLTDLDGTNGFVVNGVYPEDRTGASVSGTGDINGDGIDDLIIGANLAGAKEGDQPGSSYVVFGKTSAFSATMELSELNGIDGFELVGVNDDDETGRAVSGAGDVNGDGYKDLIIGAYGAESSYVVLGKQSGFEPSIELSTLNGSNGFVLTSNNTGGRTGLAVSAAGDVNGDGVDDIILGIKDADPNGSESGTSYVLFGSDVIFKNNFDLK